MDPRVKHFDRGTVRLHTLATVIRGKDRVLSVENASDVEGERLLLEQEKQLRAESPTHERVGERFERDGGFADTQRGDF